MESFHLDFNSLAKAALCHECKKKDYDAIIIINEISKQPIKTN